MPLSGVGAPKEVKVKVGDRVKVKLGKWPPLWAEGEEGIIVIVRKDTPRGMPIVVEFDDDVVDLPSRRIGFTEDELERM